MEPYARLGLLANRERLVAFAAVVLGAATLAEVAERSGLPARTAARAVHRLEQGGLLSTVEGRLGADPAVFAAAVRENGRTRPATATEFSASEVTSMADRARAAVLRAFVRDGRLVQMPAARAKRRVVLEHIVACFEPGVRYPEREVDAVLRAWHPDHASLRRYLIDEGLMSRKDGRYWRSGGAVTV